ncbi:MAG: DUF4476 domain-containing protein [Flavobacteriales bacterium]|nr:DUF4476 domain-containing protein [Flavobacteriales bacterium]
MKHNFTLLLLVFMLATTQNSYAQSNQWSAINKFRNCVSSMQSTNNETTRFNYAMQYFLTEHCTTIQLQDACYYLNDDQKKYDLCLSAYPNIIDKDNFFNIYDSFKTFSKALKLYHNTQESAQFAAFENDYQLGVEQDINSIFDLLVKKGDLLMSKNQFDEAVLIYQQALEISPESELVKMKIDEVSDVQFELASILEEENKLNAQFDLLIQQGDVKLSSNKVDEAIDLYEEAMLLKPGEQLAYMRIKEANNWQTTLTNNIEEENKKVAEYNFLMQKGDILMSSGAFDDAIAIFEQAGRLLPQEQMPLIRVGEVMSLRDELANDAVICSTPDEEFNFIKSSIKDKMFADEQAEMAKGHIRKGCLSNDQMKEIVSIFSMDDDKVNIIKFMYDYSTSPETFYEFRQLLTFSSTKEELDEFLLGK